jgi:hypothetical protein
VRRAHRSASLRSVRRTASLVLLLPMVAAGCGGGSKETTTQVETRPIVPLPKTDYVEVAGRSAGTTSPGERISRARPPTLVRSTRRTRPTQAADLLRQEGSNLTAELQELQALRPPAADVGTVDSVLSAVRARASVIDGWARAYDDLDEARIRALQIRLGAITSSRPEPALRRAPVSGQPLRTAMKKGLPVARSQRPPKTSTKEARSHVACRIGSQPKAPRCLPAGR